MRGAIERMNRFALSLWAIGLLYASPALAQTATEQGQSQVGVVTPLSFIQTEELNFGQIFASTTNGTVVVAPNGTRTATGGIVLVGNSHQPSEFAGMGTFNQRVQVSLGSNSIWIYGPGPRMRVRTFVIGSTPTAVLTVTPRVFRIAGPTGAFRFPVGATLEVGANQPAGTYTGTWTITLNYQ
jgi:Domain of unknown function (DUF4402)